MNIPHNRFVTLKRITHTPNVVNYQFADTLFGDALVASTSEGVCYFSYHSNRLLMMHELETMFPKSQLLSQTDVFQERAIAAFFRMDELPQEVMLHVKATAFQYEVWRLLLDVPYGTTISYGTIAQAFLGGGASRAVGNAVGRNPVAYFIPCHRVVRSDGSLGGFRWGVDRKKAMLAHERTK